jgi:hypothetical protein
MTSTATELDSTIRELVELWRSAGVKVRSPVKPAEIALNEARLGIRLPWDVAAMYRIVDGMAGIGDEFPFDDRHIRIWPISEIVSAQGSEAGPFRDSVIFGDYMLRSHEYGFSRDGKIILVAGSDSRVMYPELNPFLRDYLHDVPRAFGA